MFCSDDKHPDGPRVEPHRRVERRGLRDGIPLFVVAGGLYQPPVLHYKMNVGLLRPGDPADLSSLIHPKHCRCSKPGSTDNSSLGTATA